MQARFEPSDLNSLLTLFQRKYACTQHYIPVDSGEHSLIILQHSYFTYRCLQNKRQFVVFNLAKDAASKTNQAYLPYIGELIKKYKSVHQGSGETLLIPMRQCRGYARAHSTLWTVVPFLQCQHVVLIEVDLATQKMVLHNSQEDVSSYPDKLAEIAEELAFEYERIFYAVQKDSHSCGYYVWAYLRHMLKVGTSNDLKICSLEDGRYGSKAEFKACWDEIGEQDTLPSSLLNFEIEEKAGYESEVFTISL